MPDIRDYESAWLSAMVDFEEWMEEFETELFESINRMIDQERQRMMGAEEVQYAGKETET